MASKPKPPKRKVTLGRDPITGAYIATFEGATGVGTTRELALSALKINVEVRKERAALAAYREEIEVDW